MRNKTTPFIYLVLILLILMAVVVSAEPVVEWEKTFGGSYDDNGRSVQQTSDGGYIIAGQTCSYGAGDYDVYLVKTDSAGNMQWQKTFGGSHYDGGYSVQQTTDGGYIIAGETYSSSAGSHDVYLVKTDSSGNLQWQKTFGGSRFDYGYSVQQTTDGGYVIAGETSSYGAGGCDVYLVKTDSSGNLQWQKTFGGSGSDYGRSIQQTTDGGYIIAGGTGSYSAGRDDVYLVKTDSAGNMQWQKTFGGSDFDYGRSVQQTSDGGYIIAGHTGSYGTGSSDVYLVKTDSAGNLQWEKTFGGSYYDGGYSVQQTSNGGYIIAGRTGSYGTGGDVYLVKTDSAGNLQWEKTFGGSDSDEGFSVQQTSNDGYIIAGWTYSYGAGDYDVYLIKVGPDPAMPVKGIDVSSYQGCKEKDGQDIDWSQVYSAGYSFALVRASWWDSGVDKCFVTNMENADANGMLVGAYHFAYPEYADAGSEARHFFNVAKDYLKEGYLRPALDVENDPCFDSYPYNLRPKGLSDWVNKWMDTVQALARQELHTEVEPLLYVNRTYADFLDEHLANVYDLWIAHPKTPTCNPDGEPDTKKWNNWAFWQYYDPRVCGDNSGYVPGIEGPVDLDVFNGNMSRLNTFKISAWQPDFWILYHLCSPADMVVTDPDGLSISKDLSQIPGAAYVEIDIDGDGDLDEEISIPYKKVGYYQITAVPEANALPDDTYSLEVVLDGQTMVLAEDVQIKDIPAEPYIFESKLNRSDFDSDGDVDYVDLAKMSQYWLAQDCNYPDWCGGVDLNYNRFVDFIDFGLFAKNWLWEKIPADFDIDGDVDFQDFAIFALAWLTEEGQTGYDLNCDIAIPYDKAINEKDLQVFTDNWLLGR